MTQEGQIDGSFAGDILKMAKRDIFTDYKYELVS